MKTNKNHDADNILQQTNKQQVNMQADKQATKDPKGSHLTKKIICGHCLQGVVGSDQFYI